MSNELWQPMDTAPKDGTTIIIPLSGRTRVYWCKDLETWVLCHPLHIESVQQLGGWRHEFIKRDAVA